MLVLRAVCRALHHSLHSSVLEATGRLGSHKYTSKISSPVYSVQPWSWVVTGPSLSSPFSDSTLAILLATSSQAVPVSGLSDGRAAGSVCSGCPTCLKQAVTMGERPCAWGNTLVTREGDSYAQVLLPLLPAWVREVLEGWDVFIPQP